MDLAIGPTPHVCAMAALILLVDVETTALRRTESLLTDAGYLVAPVSSFDEAKELLETVLPDLLIAAVRLEAFNGLHLAARSRLDHPKLPVIITHSHVDPVLRNEALRQGARFVANPLENPAFLPLVEAALEEHRDAQPPIRRWRRKRVDGVMEARLATPEERLATARARIHDISYGGLRLAFARRQDLPDEYDIPLPMAGVTVKAHRAWTSPSATTDEFWCGVEVAPPGSATSDNWRTFVDSVRNQA